MSKSDYWDPLKEQYPDAMIDFLKWLDEYKRRVNWGFLFNSGDELNYGGGVFPYQGQYYRHDPKFHDLPPAMQIGIFMQYCIEHGSYFDHVATMDEAQGEIAYQLGYIQSSLKQ